MRVGLRWKDQLKDKSDKPISAYSVAFRPKGDMVVIGAGNTVMLYDVEEGIMKHKMAAHKDNIHSVAFSRDGKFFASGSADKHVIVWTEKCEGHLKYSHGEGVQCVAFSPVSHHLLSCATTDINIWSSEHKNLVKRKVTSRVCSCSWTSDGQYFALGHFNGYISIWTKNGDEKVKVDRPGGNPVFAMAWNTSRSDQYDILSVCDWNQKLSFYQLNGRQIGKERDLGFDACFFTHASGSNFTIIGGSNKKAAAYSKEGLKLADIGEEHESWVWSCAYHPQSQCIILSCADGSVECYHILPSPVHGLYKDRYAYREGLTDVIIQHLVTNDKVHVKCRDLVKKTSIYKNKLAVQIQEKILLYELATNEDATGKLDYVLRHKFPFSKYTNVLIMCNEDVIVCQDLKLLCLSLNGQVKREWKVDAMIRYVKVVGGPTGKECLLMGLQNGKIIKLFVDNPFHVTVMKINCSVKCLDISMRHTHLAIVDETGILRVYDMRKKKTVYQEPNATSVAWNTQYDDMLCYSGNGFLHIKANNFPAHKQRLQNGLGFVVGFTGSRIFSLHSFTMSVIDIPQSSSMIQYLERKMYKEAYNVACLGVTHTDWRTLALESLEGMSLEVSKKAFIRVQDYPFLNLINAIEERQHQGETDNNLFLAEIYAFQKKFHEAAKCFQTAGHSDKAVDMYTDLCEFTLAKQYMKISPSKPAITSQSVGSSNNEDNSAAIKKLITKQAEWANTTNDVKTAIDMYVSAGEYTQAILIMFDNRLTQQLIDLSVKLDISQREALKLCGQKLKALGEFGYAAEVYEKIQDFTFLASLYADTQQWQKGFDLVQFRPELRGLVYLPYATQLIEEDRFEEAQEALSKADKESEAVTLLSKLTNAAVLQNKFKDGSYYHWLQAKANLTVAQRTLKDKGDCDLTSIVNEFHHHIQRAEIYYAYQEIHKFMTQPFTNVQPDALFNMARFIMLQLLMDTPPKISKVSTLVSLGKHGMTIGAYKTARYAFNQLQSFLIPATLQEFVDSWSLTVRGKPLQDKEDLLPFCYRCSTTNSLISNGNYCSTCGEPFVYSFISFEILPLVQFYLDDDISDSEAIKLIQSEPPTRKQDGWQDKRTGDVDVLQFNEGDEDPFTSLLLSTDESGMYPRVVVDRTILAQMHWREVVVKKWSPPLRYQYYRSLLPDVQIRLCPSCNQMFYGEDYELHVLCKKLCPFCRQSPPTNDISVHEL